MHRSTLLFTPTAFAGGLLFAAALVGCGRTEAPSDAAAKPSTTNTATTANPAAAPGANTTATTGAGKPAEGAAGATAATGSSGAAAIGSATAAGPGASGAGAGAAAAAAAAASAPPVNVTLVTARKRDLPVLLEGTGTVAPTLTVDVRPQVTSMIRQVHVGDGQFVRAGQLLFTLDAAADQANVARLNAQLARDQAALADAQRQVQRSRELVSQNFVSQGAVDSAQTLVDTQTAAVAASRAAVTAGKVPLSYARITAPHGGRVGAVNAVKGSAVQANVTPLLTITQLDPIDVAFTVPQRYLADILKASQGDGAQVNATLGEGGAPLAGKLVFVDNAIDAASGSVKVKARFANPDSRLWPGAFVRTALTVRAIKDAIVIPQGAIIQSPRGTIVYVFNDGKAALRPVQVLTAEGEDVAVTGLRPGERIVLDGRQTVRPGSTLIERQREGRPAGAGGGGGGGGGRRGGAASGAASGAAPGGDAAAGPRGGGGGGGAGRAETAPAGSGGEPGDASGARSRRAQP